MKHWRYLAIFGGAVCFGFGIFCLSFDTLIGTVCSVAWFMVSYTMWLLVFSR